MEKIATDTYLFFNGVKMIVYIHAGKNRPEDVYGTHQTDWPDPDPRGPDF